jgi:hypothetical protein
MRFLTRRSPGLILFGFAAAAAATAVAVPASASASTNVSRRLQSRGGRTTWHEMG